MSKTAFVYNDNDTFINPLVYNRDFDNVAFEPVEIDDSNVEEEIKYGL